MTEDSERTIRFVVSPPGGRLDRVLSAQLPELSRTRLQSLIQAGKLSVDGVTVTKRSSPVRGGEAIHLELPAPESAHLEPEAIPLEVVFESADLLVVNKAPGMVVHPSPGHTRGTLVHAALAHAPDIRGIGGELRPGVVHRLDKDTSGLILLAKHDLALQQLQRQFKNRQVEKRYLALVDGRPETPAGRIDAPIGRDPRHRKRMAVVTSRRGRPAETIFMTREAFARHALLEVQPITGRTHQVRVHLAFIGTPVTGDRIYGRRVPSLPIRRHCLHAWKLTICLPGEQEATTLEAPLAEDIAALIDDLHTAEPPIRR